MIIYRLATGPQAGQWVLEVDGMIYDRSNRLQTLRALYPNAYVSVEYCSTISA